MALKKKSQPPAVLCWQQLMGNVSRKSQVLIKWPEIKNIIDLVNICDHIWFFAGDEIDGVLSVVRCETCYKFLLSEKASGNGISNQTQSQRRDLEGELNMRQNFEQI